MIPLHPEGDPATMALQVLLLVVVVFVSFIDVILLTDVFCVVCSYSVATFKFIILQYDHGTYIRW